MSVYVTSAVFEYSKSTLGKRLVLLAIADYADKWGVAFPAVSSLAEMSRLSPRQVQYCIRELEEMGELQIKTGAGPKGCNLYKIVLNGGAVFAPPPLEPMQSTTVGGALSCKKGAHSTSPEPPRDPSIDPPSKPPAKAAGPVTFQTFLKTCEQNQEKPISAYRPVFDYAEKIGLPEEFVQVCWNEFWRQHAPGGLTEKKKQKDWRQTFRNCVEKNWYKLWYLSPGTEKFELTTNGLVAKRASA